MASADWSVQHAAVAINGQLRNGDGDRNWLTSVGGLAGTISSGRIRASYATGTVSGTGDNVGGLVGSGIPWVTAGYGQLLGHGDQRTDHE